MLLNGPHLETDSVGAMGVGQVPGSVDLVRLQPLKVVHNQLDVPVRERRLDHLACSGARGPGDPGRDLGVRYWYPSQMPDARVLRVA